TIDHACTSFAGVPFTYEQIIAAANFDRLAGSSLKRFLQAGGKIEIQVVESIVARVPSADFYVMYGQTEATSRISTFEVHRHMAKLGSAGVPLDNLKVFALGADFRPLAAGRSGELAVCGASVAAGFWNDVDGTAERFVNGTLLTGDVGHVDGDGFIWIEGRIADFLKMRGMRVSIGEIEARLRLAEGIREIAAFPACHPRYGEAFGLAVVAEKEHDRAGIVRDLTRRIDPLWICAGINFVDSLPRNEVGKILRGRLAEKWSRVLRSSGTSGQIPSQIVIDKLTSLRMTRSAAAIFADFIGVSRRPMLVIDDPKAVGAASEVNARGVAIRGLLPFGHSVTYCGREAGSDAIELDLEILDDFLRKHDPTQPILIYGFTYIIWMALERLIEKGRDLGLRQAHVLHSGGWKTLTDRAVSKRLFNQSVGMAIGCGADRVV